MIKKATQMDYKITFTESGKEIPIPSYEAHVIGKAVTKVSCTVDDGPLFFTALFADLFTFILANEKKHSKAKPEQGLKNIIAEALTAAMECHEESERDDNSPT
tara:strand:- start:2259 stop:2567 length:309 start_codon:yes stop_codon:yes gene_type:complete